MTSFNASQSSEHGQMPYSTQMGSMSQGRQEGAFVNVGMQERYITGGAGGLLALYGLWRLGFRGLLGLAGGAMLLRRAVTGHYDMYQSLGLSTAKEAAPEEYFNRGIHVEERFIIPRPASELYAFWRKLENLPQFMSHLESVRTIDAQTSHWVANGPAGMNIEWDARIINDEPDRLISWKSLANAMVDNAGTVRFEPLADGQGTDVRVIIDYIPPGGKVGAWFARLFGRDTDQIIRKDLQRFQQLMQAGVSV